MMLCILVEAAPLYMWIFATRQVPQGYHLQQQAEEKTSARPIKKY